MFDGLTGACDYTTKQGAGTNVSLTSVCPDCAQLKEKGRGKHRARDRDRAHVSVGDRVRIVGVPDLSGMGALKAESQPVFEHLVGQVKRVEEFDELGFAWLRFIIRRGKVRGWHSVAMEPCLLKKQRSS